GTEQTITSAGWTGEKSNVNVIAGNTYVFRVNNSAHFITIAKTDNTIVASGNGTVTYVPNFSGQIYFYHHLSSVCDYANSNVTRYVTCTSLPPAPCTVDTVTTYPFTETFENDSPSRQCWTNVYVEGESDWTYASGAAAGAITTGY